MKKILIIDDDPDILTMLEYRLNTHNFVIQRATNKAEALKEAEKQPDLIILDIMMPSDSEGFVLFSKFKLDELTKDIPVIFLSRKIEDREKALKMGACYFIEKPYDGGKLIENINMALGGKREALSEE